MIEHIHYKLLEKVLFTQSLFFNNKDAKNCIDYIESNKKLKNFFNLSKIISTVFDYIPRSNINSIPLKINFDSQYNHILYDISFKKSLKEIMDERALDLKELMYRSNKKLGIMWSGGIDSTSIIVSILKNFSKQDLKNVEIYLNESSIIENILFFKDHIVNNFKLVNCRDGDYNVKYHENNSNYIIVDGEPADLIFGSDFYINKFLKADNFKKMYLPWKDNLNLILSCFSVYNDPNEKKFTVDNNYIEWFIEQQINNMSKTNIPVETLMDFFWWINFDNRWAVRCIQKNLGYIDKNLFNDTNNINFQEYNNIIYNTEHFFNTSDFQSWATTQRKIECINFKTIYDYKMPLKDYIYNYTRDEFYRLFKTKVNSNSQSTLYTYNTNFLYEKQEENLVYFNTLNLSKVQDVLEYNANQ